MLYGEEALAFAKKYLYASLQMLNYEMDDDGNEIPDTREWVDVNPNAFGPHEWQHKIEEEQVRVDDEAKYYINSYLVDRHYGGPEEGGWWYDAGFPISTAVVVSPELVPEVRDKIQAELQAEFEWGNIYSVLGGEQVFTYVEQEFPKPFPQYQPHYE